MVLQVWAMYIEKAEAPLLLSPRDGLLLKPVTPQHRLPPPALRAAVVNLCQVL